MLEHNLTDTKNWFLHRVGLMGNPSDGFNGKTIAMSISNFWAEVTLVESQTLVTHTRTHKNTFIRNILINILYMWVSVSSVGFGPSPTQWPHRVWKPAGSVLYQQEGRVCTQQVQWAPTHGRLDHIQFFFLNVVFIIHCRYLGGLRLLQATCKKFYQFCSKQGWESNWENTHKIFNYIQIWTSVYPLSL